MRLAAIASALAIVLCVAVFGAILFQKRSVSGLSSAPALVASVEGQASGAGVTAEESAAVQAPAATRAPTVIAQASPPSPWPAFAPPPLCSNPNALGIARVVEIDTTGGPGFGFEHFKSHHDCLLRRGHPEAIEGADDRHPPDLKRGAHY
jgi:hypothetical protein